MILGKFIRFLITPEDSRSPESLLESQQKFPEFRGPVFGAIKIFFLIGAAIGFWILIPFLAHFIAGAMLTA